MFTAGGHRNANNTPLRSSHSQVHRHGHRERRSCSSILTRVKAFKIFGPPINVQYLEEIGKDDKFRKRARDDNISRRFQRQSAVRLSPSSHKSYYSNSIGMASVHSRSVSSGIEVHHSRPAWPNDEARHASQRGQWTSSHSQPATY